MAAVFPEYAFHTGLVFLQQTEGYKGLYCSRKAASVQPPGAPPGQEAFAQRKGEGERLMFWIVGGVDILIEHIRRAAAGNHFVFECFEITC